MPSRSPQQRERDALRAQGRCIFSGRPCRRARRGCDFNTGRGGEPVKFGVCLTGMLYGAKSCQSCADKGRCEEAFKCFLEKGS